MKSIILIIVLIIFTTKANSQFITYGTIEPFDESYTDPSFSQFISELKTAIVNKDVEYVYNML